LNAKAKPRPLHNSSDSCVVEKKRYRTVATGGTFDRLHRGHEALLSKSFEVGEKVVVGVTSDEFARREGKRPEQPYSERVKALRHYLDTGFPGRAYLISKLDDYFGPGIASPDVEAIVVSPETAKRVELANKMRAIKGFPPLKVITVGFVLAADGSPISSTRIRAREIDEAGRTLKSS
jgi:cytidyltransferase-like protein